MIKNKGYIKNYQIATSDVFVRIMTYASAKINLVIFLVLLYKIFISLIKNKLASVFRQNCTLRFD